MSVSDQAVLSCEEAHKRALTIIYRHTHKDYKGRVDGVPMLLVNRRGATVLVPLDDLTEAEVGALLPGAMKKEAARLAAKR